MRDFFDDKTLVIFVMMVLFVVTMFTGDLTQDKKEIGLTIIGVLGGLVTGLKFRQKEGTK